MQIARDPARQRGEALGGPALLRAVVAGAGVQHDEAVRHERLAQAPRGDPPARGPVLGQDVLARLARDADRARERGELVDAVGTVRGRHHLIGGEKVVQLVVVAAREADAPCGTARERERGTLQVALHVERHVPLHLAQPADEGAHLACERAPAPRAEQHRAPALAREHVAAVEQRVSDDHVARAVLDDEAERRIGQRRPQQRHERQRVDHVTDRAETDDEHALRSGRHPDDRSRRRDGPRRPLRMRERGAAANGRPPPASEAQECAPCDAEQPRAAGTATPTKSERPVLLAVESSPALDAALDAFGTK